jgi:hypothetical protein
LSIQNRSFHNFDFLSETFDCWYFLIRKIWSKLQCTVIHLSNSVEYFLCNKAC